MIFHAADLGELLAFRHVVMDQAQAAIECHGDGHARFGHGVHVGRNDRNVQVQAVGQLHVELRVAREDFGIKRGQRDVVVGQREVGVRREKHIRRLVELGIEVLGLCWHVQECSPTHYFGKRESVSKLHENVL